MAKGRLAFNVRGGGPQSARDWTYLNAPLDLRKRAFQRFAGSFDNVAILIARAVMKKVNERSSVPVRDCKKIRGSWMNFLRDLRERGLRGTPLFIGDKCIGLLVAVHTTYHKDRYKLSSVYFGRNVLSVVPRGRMRLVAAIFREILAQEYRQATIATSKDVIN